MRNIVKLLNELAARLRAAIRAERKPEPEELTLFWTLSWTLALGLSRQWCQGRVDLSPEEIANGAVSEIARRFPACVNLHTATYTTYLWRTTRNRYLDALRRARVRQAISVQLDENIPLPPAPGLSPEAACLRKEQLARLKQALKTLADFERTMILEVIGKITIEEARRRLNNISPATYFRWRKKLLEHLRGRVS